MGADHVVALWRPETGEIEELEQSPDGAFIAHPSPDQRHLLVGDVHGAGGIRWWDLDELTMRDIGTVGDGGVRELRVLPDSQHVLTASMNGQISAWDVETRTSQELGRAEGAVKTIAISADGAYFTVGSEDGTLLVCDAHELDSIDCTKVTVTGPVRRSTFIADTHRVAMGHQGGEITILDLDTNQTIAVGTLPHYAHLLAASRDGRFLVAASSNDSEIRAWDLASGVSFVLQGHTQGISALYFSRSDHRLFSASDDRSIRLWELDQVQIPPTTHDGIATWITQRSTAVIGSQDRAATPAATSHP